MKHIMDIHKGDVYFSGSDIGWVVGHHFIVYGPLIRGKERENRNNLKVSLREVYNLNKLI